jgi:hypothetical protein
MFASGLIANIFLNTMGDVEKISFDKVRFSSTKTQDSILPNFDFFVFPIFAFKLGHFKVQTIFSHATNTQDKKNGKNLCFTKKKV